MSKVIQWPLPGTDARPLVDGVPHGYTYISELLREKQRDTVDRPTEYDAILSMRAGYTVLRFSSASMDYGGGDTSAYSKPTVTEREQMLEQGKKWCPDHKAYLPVYEFNADASKRDGYDSVCRHCRAQRHAERRLRKTA